MEKIFRLKKASEVTSINTKNGAMSKRTIVLQELGGEYADGYVVNVFGQDAQADFRPGSLYYAKLRFRVNEYDGNTYQDISAQALFCMGQG